MTRVGKGCRVKVHYIGKLLDGTIFDTSKEGAPFEFVVGEKQVIEGFEESVMGLEVGDTKKITIPFDKAYGKHISELVVEVDRKNLPEGVKPELGQMLELKQPDGSPLLMIIVGLTEDKVTLDANHPLAGKDLIFEFEVIEVAEKP